jgi:Probable cobalt transporter subunit (CbtA)
MTQHIGRGVAAGLIAGVLAGLLALAFAEPSVDAAIALEETASGGSGHHAHNGDHLTRRTQKVGLVAGTALYGVGIGAVFGVAGAWATGRLRGDAWTRACKLGAVAVAAFVALPALAYPPNPPAVGDPATVGSRTGLFVVLWVSGLALAFAAWASTRALAGRAWSRPAIHVTVGAAALAAVAGLLALLPAAPGAGAFPADLLWSFRLWSIATQVLVFGGTAVCFGALSAHAEHGQVPRTRTPS